MNILILARYDHSGAGYAMMQAINEHTEHQAQQVAHADSYLDYPVDVFSPSANDLSELWEWADVVNVHDEGDVFIPENGPYRPMFTTYHGSEYRSRWPWYNEYDRRRGRIQTALNLDLAMLGPRWLPRPVEDLWHLRHYVESHDDGNLFDELFEAGHGQSSCCTNTTHFWKGLPGCCAKFRVAHAPTNRAIKDTDKVIKALDGLDDVELVLIENKSNAECIEIKATCHLLLEEFKLGYGTNALECWAMGIPVVAHAFPGITNYIRHNINTLPYVDTPLEDLRERVIELRDDRDAYTEAADRGRAYWLMYHEPARVAERIVQVCEETLVM